MGPYVCMYSEINKKKKRQKKCNKMEKRGKVFFRVSEVIYDSVLYHEIAL